MEIKSKNNEKIKFCGTEGKEKNKNKEDFSICSL